MQAISKLISANFTPDREGFKPRYIVLHTMVGSLEGTARWFANGQGGNSAHYGVGLNGQIHQYVREKNTAWHSGNWNMNLRSIGIEHEDRGNYMDPVRTDALYNATIKLCADICRRYNLPADTTTFKVHRDVSDAPTKCPGGLDVARIIRGVRKELKVKDEPKVVPPTPHKDSGPNIEYFKLDKPIKVRALKTPTNIYGFGSAKSWDDFVVTRSITKGSLLTIVGKAKHPLGGVYFMTARSFGDGNPRIDKDFTPDFANGVNREDVEIVEQTDQQRAAETAELIDSIVSSRGIYKAVETVTVRSLTDKTKTKVLRRGDIVRKSGQVKSGSITYAFTNKSIVDQTFYAIPHRVLKPTQDPTTPYKGELVKDVTSIDSEVDAIMDDVFKEGMTDPSLTDEMKSFKNNLNLRERLVALIARAVGWFDTKKIKKEK